MPYPIWNVFGGMETNKCPVTLVINYSRWSKENSWPPISGTPLPRIHEFKVVDESICSKIHSHVIKYTYKLSRYTSIHTEFFYCSIWLCYYFTLSARELAFRQTFHWLLENAQDINYCLSRFHHTRLVASQAVVLFHLSLPSEAPPTLGHAMLCFWHYCSHFTDGGQNLVDFNPSKTQVCIFCAKEYPFSPFSFSKDFGIPGVIPDNNEDYNERVIKTAVRKLGFLNKPGDFSRRSTAAPAWNTTYEKYLY